MHVEIIHEKDRQRFVATLDDRPSYLRYTEMDEGTLDFRSTFVHPESRGRGVGEKLVKTALDYAREQGKEVVPTCWFVDTVVRRNPHYGDLLR